MHIGLDISQTGAGKAGCGFFAHAVVEAMLELAPEHRYTLLPSFGDFYFDPLMPVRSPYVGRDVHYGPRCISRETSRALWARADVEDAIGCPEIVHSNNFWCPTGLSNARLIYTFYDMGFVVCPEWTTEANRIGCFEGVFRSAVEADWVVAISKASRDHYLRVFPHFPEERIRVVYPCSRFSDASAMGVRPAALGPVEEGKFWLNVGTVEPRKNQHRLAEGYARYLAQGGEPMPLVLAGGKGWLMDDFSSHLRKLGIEAKVIMTGYVSDDELIWLYRNCYANLYPSLFEGFGLPVLEGMQFGAPTLASDSTSIPEVTGHAAVLLSPTDVEGWAQAMISLSRNGDERQRLVEAARQRATTFDWRRSAGELLELYHEALASPTRRGAV